VQSGIESAVGHLDPEVLGSLDVAGVAEGQQIAGDVRRCEVQPETLRDKVVDDEPVSGSAVSTSSVTGNDLGAEGLPSDSLVAPLFAAPGGIGIADHPVPVVGGHASAGAVGSGPSAFEVVGAEVAETGLTGEDRHSENHTINGGNLQCSECGGIVAENIQDGLGTALKPALELIAMARKPLSEKSIAANVLKWGTGALNIDACRIATDEDRRRNAAGGDNGLHGSSTFKIRERRAEDQPITEGRWPANLCHDGSDEVVAGFPDLGQTAGSYTRGTRAEGEWLHAKEAGTHQTGFGDSGSAARFFYCAKATTEERGVGNNHPTVKPVALMRWLCRLVTPKGGTVLDPFMGSGSTALACDAEQFDFIGCELSPAYAAIAESRVRAAAGMFAEVKAA
jgi:hypothetical protein